MKPLRASIAYPLAVLSGVVYFLGFPGVNAWPFALVAQVPLLLALRGQTPRRAVGLGVLSGFFVSITGFYWLYGMLRTFSGMPVAACVALMAVLCVYQGGRTGLLGWLYARAERRGWPVAYAFALAFVASELVYPLLFPWYFGASVHNAPVLLQTADIGGPYLVGLVLLGSNLAIAEAIMARLERRRVARSVVGIGLALPLLGAVYGVVRLRQIEARMSAAPSIKIGIAQGNMPLVGRRNAVKTHLGLTEYLRRQGAELVVWSEGSVPRHYPEPTYPAEVKKDLTGKLGVASIVGIGIQEDTQNPMDAREFNSAVMADAEGNVVGRYDKRYLLAFGEYLPFGETFPKLYRYSPNSGRYSPGKSLEPFVWNGHRVSAMICYEDILPAYVNGMVAHASPDLMVDITNDAWFGDTTEPLEHLALAQLRAIEHRRYLVRSANSGISAIVDATGRLVVRSGTFNEDAILGEARFMTARTIYERTGDAPFWGCALAIFAMGFVPYRRKQSGSTTASKPS